MYKQPELTPVQMLDKVEDARAVENIMGKLVFHMSYRHFDTAWETLWSKENEPTLTLNDGKYAGTVAVKSWFVDYQNAVTARANELMRERYPEELGKLTADQTAGAGFNSVLNNTTPLIEIAHDRQTAKGVWYLFGEMTEVHDEGITAYWCMGRYGADFVNEKGEWKLWHLQMFTDYITPVGEKYAPAAKALSVSGVKEPEFSEEGAFFVSHSGDHPSPRKPEMPVPYESFADTFSY